MKIEQLFSIHLQFKIFKIKILQIHGITLDAIRKNAIFIDINF